MKAPAPLKGLSGVTIEVEEYEASAAELAELPGTPIVQALIGPDMQLFQIRKDKNRFTYYIGRTKVPAEVYRDALETGDKDRYCEGCMADEEPEPDVLGEPTPLPTEPS